MNNQGQRNLIDNVNRHDESECGLTDTISCAVIGEPNSITENLEQKKITLLLRTSSMTLCIPAKVLLHEWSYDFYDMTLSTGKQRRHMININHTIPFIPY